MSNIDKNTKTISMAEWQHMLDHNTPYKGIVDGGEGIGKFYALSEVVIETHVQNPYEDLNKYSQYKQNIRYNHHITPLNDQVNLNNSSLFNIQLNDTLNSFGSDTINNVDRNDSTTWTDFGRGVRGPVIGGTSLPVVPKKSKLAKTIWKESRLVKGAKPNTSVASLALRRVLHKVKPWKLLPKATSLGGQLGRVAGGILGPIGIVLTIYDAYVFLDRPLSEIAKEARENSLSTTGVNYPGVNPED